jgi:hypothetical protein
MLSGVLEPPDDEPPDDEPPDDEPPDDEPPDDEVVMEFEEVPAEFPRELIATTVNVYVVEAVRPETVIVPLPD